MSFSVQNNSAASQVLFNLDNNLSAMNQVGGQLSSGYKINSAANDAAGLAIATQMQNQVNGLNQASQNAQDGVSMLQTMGGGVTTISDMLGRMRELALQAANGTQTQANRSDIVTELTQIQAEINRTAGSVQYNTQTLLTGISKNGIQFQVGANANQIISLNVSQGADLRASVNGGGGLGVGTTAITSIAQSGTAGMNAAESLVQTIDKALSTVSTFNANIGAVEDRLNYAIQNLSSESNNLTNARSGIMDTNMASAMTKYSQDQVLVQAGMSMLSHAQQVPSMVLSLLQ